MSETMFDVAVYHGRRLSSEGKMGHKFVRVVDDEVLFFVPKRAIGRLKIGAIYELPKGETEDTYVLSDAKLVDDEVGPLADLWKLEERAEVMRAQAEKERRRAASENKRVNDDFGTLTLNDVRGLSVRANTFKRAALIAAVIDYITV